MFARWAVIPSASTLIVAAAILVAVASGVGAGTKEIPALMSLAAEEDRFVQLSLQTVSEHTSPVPDNLGLKAGERTLLGIPFEIGWTTTTQCSHVPTRPERIWLQAPRQISQPSKVHILFQAGFGLLRYEGARIGQIDIHFSEGSVVTRNLILGENIRDWSDDSTVAVSWETSDEVHEAWRGVTPDGRTGHMDVLSIPIPANLRNELIEGIEFFDHSIVATGEVDPCLHVQAVTVERAAEPCSRLAGTGQTVRFALVPAGYDDADPAHVAEFESLTQIVATGISATEPFASNRDRFVVYQVNDYRGRALNPWSCGPIWYNPSLIAAAGACDYTQIIVIPRRSGCAGGNPSGNFSMAGPGHCPAGDCNWNGIVYTALHEVGHTLAGFRHVCAPGDADLARLLESEIRHGPLLYLPSLTHGAPILPDLDDAAQGTPFVELPMPIETWTGEGHESLDAATAAQPRPLPNCSEQDSGSPAVPCNDWRATPILRWALPGDPPHGCYRGCDGNRDWFRPWPAAEPAVMCRDDDMKNGFTPVERRQLHDMLQQQPPPPR